jgi:hypothetical protein
MGARSDVARSLNSAGASLAANCSSVAVTVTVPSSANWIWSLQLPPDECAYVGTRLLGESHEGEARTVGLVEDCGRSWMPGRGVRAEESPHQRPVVPGMHVVEQSSKPDRGSIASAVSRLRYLELLFALSPSDRFLGVEGVEGVELPNTTERRTFLRRRVGRRLRMALRLRTGSRLGWRVREATPASGRAQRSCPRPFPRDNLLLIGAAEQPLA